MSKGEKSRIKTMLQPRLATATLFCFAILGSPLEVSASTSLDTTESYAAVQQSGNVKGRIVDSKGEPIIGANILIEGTTTGTITDFDGYFVLNNVPDNGFLEISYVGFKTTKVAIDGRSEYNIVLKEDTELLGEVVVTAMGIERKSTALTYSADVLGGKELTRAKDANFINSLQGKSAGLIITPSTTGAGGSSKILLRGNTSIMGNNSPLIVVDGIPMQNQNTTQINSTYGGQRDGGDALSNINPDDIESINILKGASAAALYGSMAANGAIIITTKSGNEGKLRIDVSSNTTIETPMVLPELQNTYGSTPNSNTSWGEKISGEPAKNNLKDFFNVGANFNNSVALSGGNKIAQTYFSYGNTSALGITPTNKFVRHNLTLRESFDFFDGIMKADVSANYIKQKGVNRPASGGLHNPISGLYLMPRDQSIKDFETYETETGEQIWPWKAEDNQNPYWILNRMRSEESRSRAMITAHLGIKATDWLNLDGRISYDRTDDEWDRKHYATSYNINKGRYNWTANTYEQIYGDFLATVNKDFSGYNLNVVLGTSFTDQKSEGNEIFIEDSHEPYFSNWFMPGNSKLNPNKYTYSHKRQYAVFGSANLDFRGYANLEATVRNDWSSSLYGTSSVSYFYPSFGANLLLHKIFNMNEDINLFKFRGSYSIVGNDIPAGITTMSDMRFVMGSGGSLKMPDAAPFTELKPEKTHSMEFGLEFGHRCGFTGEITYYKSNTHNQFFMVKAPWGSGYNNRYINAGNVQNQGIELSLGYSKEWNNVSWISKLNFAYNDNKILELVEGLENPQLAEANGFYMFLKENGSYGDVYVRDLIVSESGEGNNKTYSLASSDEATTKVGTLNSKIHMGWANTINYKDFTLYFLIDGKIGGNVLALTQGKLDLYGVSQASADVRDNGGKIEFQGHEFDAYDYYQAVAGSSYKGDDYVYSATNFRLRELSLGYTFRNLFGQSKDLNVSLVGRNLFFFYKDAPVDPDVSASTANGWQGIDYFNLPSTRSFGLNFKMSF